jgi:hypothetical protein
MELGGPAAVGDGRVVRVMSVPGARTGVSGRAGAGLGHRINMNDVRDPLLLHGELGLGFRDYDMERKIRRDTLSHAAIAYRQAGRPCRKACGCCTWP